MTYKGINLSCKGGRWVAMDRGEVIAEGSKDYVFSVIDSLT